MKLAVSGGEMRQDTSGMVFAGLLVNLHTPTVKQLMERMLLRLCFSQTVDRKLGEDQGKDFPWILASLSDNDIATTHDVICRFNGLVSGKTPDKSNQITVLPIKNPKLTMLMFNTIEHCSRDYETRCDSSTSVLSYQHQWELKGKKTDNTEVPKVNKDDWGGNYGVHSSAPQIQEEGVRGTLLAYVAWQCVKVANTLTFYLAYLSLDQEMIARASLQLRQCQTSEDSGLARHEEC